MIFLVIDQAKKVRLFEKIFLVANISLDVVFEILFLNLSDANIDFAKKKFWQRFYSNKKALFTIKQVGLVEKKGFAAITLYPRYKTFVGYIVFLNNSSNYQENDIYPSRKLQIAELVTNNNSTLILIEYTDFINIFSLELVSK